MLVPNFLVSFMPPNTVFLQNLSLFSVFLSNLWDVQLYLIYFPMNSRVTEKMRVCIWKVMQMSNFWYIFLLPKLWSFIPLSSKDLRRKVLVTVCECACFVCMWMAWITFWSIHCNNIWSCSLSSNWKHIAMWNVMSFRA